MHFEQYRVSQQYKDEWMERIFLRHYHEKVLVPYSRFYFYFLIIIMIIFFILQVVKVATYYTK